MAIQRFDNNKQFDEIIHIIEQSRENALRKVNEELIMMYWQVGEYISRESEEASYGDSYIQSLADFFSQNYPQIKGFNRRGLYRMKQFYETYKDDEKGAVKKRSQKLCSSQRYLYLQESCGKMLKKAHTSPYPKRRTAF